MHEAIIAGRTFLYILYMKVVGTCEPNKRGVSRRYRAANFLLETPLFKVWLRPWLHWDWKIGSPNSTCVLSSFVAYYCTH